LQHSTNLFHATAPLAPDGPEILRFRRATSPKPHIPESFLHLWQISWLGAGIVGMLHTHIRCMDENLRKLVDPRD
jgi:hypothetical protein